MSLHRCAEAGDLPALMRELRNPRKLEARDEHGRTPLAAAVESPRAGVDVVSALIDAGADVNAVVHGGNLGKTRSILAIAAKAGNREKVEALVRAGADGRYIDPNGYSVLLNAVYGCCSLSPEEQHALIKFLIDAGAATDAESSYGESPVRVASHAGRFALVRQLLDRGANPAPLHWAKIHRAVVFGSINDVKRALEDGAALERRDCWERTPLLLSIHAGRIDVAETLLAHGADRTAVGRCGTTAWELTIAASDVAMVQWLIRQGWDVEQADEFGNFPLLVAAGSGRADIVAILLAAGARPDRRDEYDHGTIHAAKTPEIVNLLYDAGEELSEVGGEMRAKLTGVVSPGKLTATEADFRRWGSRTFGRQNPERMNNRYWDDMVRLRWSAYAAADQFHHDSFHDGPAWCFDRFGQSLTRLPDGRYVEIAGEHEDYYDPDFCIYNDVVVHRGDGTFDVFGYPDHIFPPTDFHTATYCKPYIYIIGNLGYHDRRWPGETPVYRLHCRSWTIERVAATGDSPGWINRHRQRLIDDARIRIWGGQVILEEGGDLHNNERVYELDLCTSSWHVVAEPR